MEKINDSGLCMVQMPAGPIKLRFGMPANRMIFAKLAVKPDMLKADKLNEHGVAFLMHAGYVNACMADDIPEALAFADFYEFVEDNLDAVELFKMIANCYSNSRHTKKSVEQAEKWVDDQKKKMQTSTGTGSSPSATENLGSDQQNTTGSPGDSSS